MKVFFLFLIAVSTLYSCNKNTNIKDTVVINNDIIEKPSNTVIQELEQIEIQKQDNFFSFLDGKVYFEIPTDGVKKYGIENKKKAAVTVLANARSGRDLYNSERNINSAIFEKQLASDNFEIVTDNMERIILKNSDAKDGFVFKKSDMGLFKESQMFLQYDNRMLGESILYIPDITEYPLDEIKYEIYFSAYGVYLHIGIYYLDTNSDISLLQYLPNLFYNRDGEFYWKDEKAVMEFYELLESDEYRNFPAGIRLLRETRDKILLTLKIENETVQNFYDDDFMKRFALSTTVEYGLHIVDIQEESIFATVIGNGDYIRTEASHIHGDIIKFAKTNQKCSIISYSLEMDKIGSSKDRWYKIKLQDGTIGWIFGAYLSIDK